MYRSPEDKRRRLNHEECGSSLRSSNALLPKDIVLQPKEREKLLGLPHQFEMPHFLFSLSGGLIRDSEI